ncbi:MULTISPECIES: DUF2919 family protein [unclassified Pseudoalteromonas]|uniref:DUF2919 family protein n=1 Tax=unclassified Pseudoalteromonas TaxID=194690 RepID=UPI0020976282|nr:DUF2919 family protein [Pseudoalteromonas sp. XMcav2-N]MCO7188341.1 DUF2919 domain-containing protein [Pseudoalteromonas sp. XMcav2-N]
MSKLQAGYGPEYWDKYGVYRTPVGFNLTLLVLLRPLFLWLVSALTWRPDLDLMSLFFHSKQHFFVAVMIASLALIPTVLFSLRRPTSSPKLARYWRHMRWPLLIAACLDLVWLGMQIVQAHYQFSFYLAIQAVLVCWVILYLLKSRYLTCFFGDWPEPENN